MDRNRRIFLRNAARIGLVMASMPFVTSCGGITRNNRNMGDGTNMGALQDIIGPEGVGILRLASLAPSGHNTQPWTVTIIDPTHWIIGSDPSRWLQVVDPENREMMLSIGAFLENLILAAGYFGYAVNPKIIAETAKSPEIIHITLTKGKESQEDGILHAMRARRTVKMGLFTKELASEDFKYITNADSERLYYFPPKSREGKYLTEGTLEANRLQAYRAPAQEELADWIRWSYDDARQHRDGLTPASLDITGLVGWYVRTFYDRSNVLTKGFREATMKKVTEQVSNHGGWIVMTSDGTSLPVLLETGRRFQRMFLQVRERMIGIHPMTQMLEETSSSHQIAQELGVNGTVQFIVRTGYLKSYPEPVSLRRPVSWFTRS